MTSPFPKAKNGQSLVEVLFALAVAMLVVLALVRVTVTSIHNASFARNRALATRYAQEWMEEARKLRNEQGDAFFTLDSCDSFDNDPDGRGIFDRDRDCSLSGDTMTVEVTVTWTDAAGPHESKLTTYLTKWK